jgi:hypothetical protein
MKLAEKLLLVHLVGLRTSMPAWLYRSNSSKLLKPAQIVYVRGSGDDKARDPIRQNSSTPPRCHLLPTNNDRRRTSARRGGFQTIDSN